MTPLFLLWHAPDYEKFWHCFEYASTGSSILLLGDACYIGLANNHQLKKFKKQLKHLHAYALAEDLTTRNITYCENFPMQLIDYDYFVVLTENHHPIISWN